MLYLWRVMAAVALLAPLSFPSYAAKTPVSGVAPAVLAVEVDKAKLARDVDQLLALLDVDVDVTFLHDSEVRLLDNGKENGAIPKVSWPHLDAAVKTAFAAERLRRIIRQSFIENIDPAYLPEMLAWYDSDLGKKITEVQNKVMNFVGEEAMFAYRDNPQSAPPSESRLKLLRRLDDLTQSSANEDIILQNMQKIFVDGFAFYQKNSAGDVKKITDLITDNRTRTAQRTVLSMAFIYRELSDVELEQNLTFLASPAGKKFVAVANLAERRVWTDIHKNHLLLMMGQMIDKLDPP